MLAFTRSMLANNCGVDARNVLNTLASSGRLMCASDKSSVASCNATGTSRGTVLHHELETARRAQPLHRRRRHDERSVHRESC